MAYDSVISAVLSLYDSLTASLFPGGTRPPIHFDEVPATDGTGALLAVPFVVLKDGGGRPQFDEEFNGFEPADLTIEVYAATLADVDAIVKAVKWNGQAPGAKAGFDFGTLDLAAPLYAMSLVRGTEQRSLAGLGQAGQRVHRCTLGYSATAGVRAAG